MREGAFFEARLLGSRAWRVSVGVLAALAIAAVAGWAGAMLDAQSASGRTLVVGLAVVLALATVAVALSLARVDAGVLTCRDGAWTFVADGGGAVREGELEVAIDLGGFVLLRLGESRRASAWLPVDRAGLAGDWHALRCAIHAPPVAGASTTATSPRG